MSRENMHGDGVDPTCRLTDDCLALILDSVDPMICRLVCRSWLAAEFRTRRKLRINVARGRRCDVLSLLARYSVVSDLSLSGDWNDKPRPGKMDTALSLVSLTRLSLHNWILTHVGMSAIANNCPRLRSFYCYIAEMVDGRAIATLIEGCPLLHHITLHDIYSSAVTIGLSSTSLRSIHLCSIDPDMFAPLLSCSSNLATLKLYSLPENDPLFANISLSLVKICVYETMLTDHALFAISRCTNLQVLKAELDKHCTDAGLVAIANKCRLLCKVHIINHWHYVCTVGDKSLTALLTCCPNLRKLHIHGIINVTPRSLGLIATNCRYLERLSLFRILAFGDAELSSIAANCNSLKILRIASCSISQHGIQAIANGCPNLVELLAVGEDFTLEDLCWLKSQRTSLLVMNRWM